MSFRKVLISQAHHSLGESLCIHSSPSILASTLKIKKLTRIEFIAIFEGEISIGDVFAVTPFRAILTGQVVHFYYKDQYSLLA